MTTPAKKEPIDFSKRTITVMGTVVQVDTVDDLEIHDVSEGMTKVASHMAWWASVKGEAERECIQVDAAYRAWRANIIKTADPKLAEWRVKALIEANPAFIAHKNAIARCESNVTVAHGMFEAFSKKANTLQSKGAAERQEREATGMTTPAEPRPARTPARGAKSDLGPASRPTREGPLARPHKAALAGAGTDSE